MKSDLLEELGINLHGKKNGSIKTTCPKCSENRKNKKDPCLSVDIDAGLYNCHNCDFKGHVFEKIKREYVKPLPRLEKLSAKSIQFFESRGISNNTLLRMQITESNEWMPSFDSEVRVICFNYYRLGELVNIKFRGPKKTFKMAKDAELIFYNLDALQDEETAIIVEGEIDCLTLHECGIYNVVSVPNGASRGSQKLEYLDNCWNVFDGMSKVILAVDSDEPGRNLREELARRIGKEKCFTVDYAEGCKDANEVLMKFGRQAITHMIEIAREWPIEGVKLMDDIFPTVSDWFENGYPKGAVANITGLDHLLTFAPGQLTVVTGIPGHGKDEFMNWVMTALANNEGWPWVICGFEETPEETTTKLIEKHAGKSFAVRKNVYDRVSIKQYEDGISFVDRFFSFINTEDIDTDIDGILSVCELLVKKKGIKGVYINPWNWIEHKRHSGISETEYVSDVLSKIIRFAKKRGTHVFLLAHTTKMQKDKNTKKYEVPTLYSISGSAHFYNKTHNGMTIYRDFENGVVDVYVQKVKQSWLGQTGFSTYTYDTMTRQYKFLNSSVQ